jgi:hypothetical protein
MTKDEGQMTKRCPGGDASLTREIDSLIRHS